MVFSHVRAGIILFGLITALCRLVCLCSRFSMPLKLSAGDRCYAGGKCCLVLHAALRCRLDGDLLSFSFQSAPRTSISGLESLNTHETDAACPFQCDLDSMQAKPSLDVSCLLLAFHSDLQYTIPSRRQQLHCRSAHYQLHSESRCAVPSHTAGGTEPPRSWTSTSRRSRRARACCLRPGELPISRRYPPRVPAGVFPPIFCDHVSSSSQINR